MIVITGVTGAVRRPLVDLLTDQGVAVRAVSRSVGDQRGDLPRKPAPVTAEVEQILGRPVRSFAQWVSDHANTFQVVAA